MVRREEEEPASAGADSRCVFPTGGSPVPVGAGAPGSRPRAVAEMLPAQAGRREPLRREQERGPQPSEVKPAASKHEQWRSRAGHVTAKATSDAQKSGDESASGPSGVEGAARVQGNERNTGDPSAQPQSRRGGSYKPSAKSSAAQRESEGIVVPTMAATNNAAGGKGPCGGQAGGGG